MLRLRGLCIMSRPFYLRQQFPNCFKKTVESDLLYNKSLNRSFLQFRTYKAASTYIEEMYNAWLRDPTSVHRSWDSYFRSAPNMEVEAETSFMPNALASLETVSCIDRAIDEHALVNEVIKNYQTQGHTIANLNPLDSAPPGRETLKMLNPDLNFDELLKKEFRLPSTTFIGNNATVLPLTEIIKRLEEAYCDSIGIEYGFLNSMEQCNWLRKQFEKPGICKIDSFEQRLILTRLINTVGFENFLSYKFPTEKRFSIEGCETLIPALKKIIDISSESGVECVVMGMQQRGRLNVLANVFKKPLKQIFSLFTGAGQLDEDLSDIKYSYGTCIERLNRISLRPVRMAMVASPAHFEAFVPVVQGRSRAEQFFRGDEAGRQVMPVLVHNDASFYGQGLVGETMNLTTLPNFRTYGTIHVVISDQTREFLPSQCTNIAYAANAPIFHVNADDPDAVVYASKVAANWRAKFHKDVVLHLIGYHRQSDFDEEFIFMQPHLYQKIQKQKPCLENYMHKLRGTFVVTPEEAKQDMSNYEDKCEEALDKARKEVRFQKWFWIDTPWSDFFETKIPFKVSPTGVDLKSLVDLANRFLSPPKNKPDFVLHKELHRVLADRKVLVDSRKVDWALAEALAFGSLLNEGIHVRLSGQDVERGTFSHRHHVLHHMLVENTTHNLLQHLYPNQAVYAIANSTLSENAALGFEVGYATTNPNALVLWEAQFGDFANNAQCIIDELIASGQTNLVRQCGIVLLLPHGMGICKEAMGPEHSSARLERFLQSCSDDPDYFPQDIKNFSFSQLRDTNWIVANCTTPANYFHILRRQIALPFRKPLILMTPKSLLRQTSYKSSFEELDNGTEFKPLIPDQNSCKDPREVKKLIFCSGRIYYDLLRKRAEYKNESEIAIVRVEQLSPFPFDLVKKQIEYYESAELIWAQEEHKNQGAWSYVSPRFVTAIPDSRPINYIGRPASAILAAASKNQHNQELKAIINETIYIDSLVDNANW